MYNLIFSRRNGSRQNGRWRNGTNPLFSVFSACAHDMQVSQGMVGQSAARRAAGIILEMVKVSLMCVCVRGHSLVL